MRHSSRRGTAAASSRPAGGFVPLAGYLDPGSPAISIVRDHRARIVNVARGVKAARAALEDAATPSLERGARSGRARLPRGHARSREVTGGAGEVRSGHGDVTEMRRRYGGQRGA